MTKQWGRLLTAMITPYDKVGNVDYNQVSDLATNLFQNGSDGLVLWGTTAESPVLSVEEKERIFHTVREKSEVNGSLIVATGTNDTKTTIANTIRAKELGADGVMVVVPYYNKPSQRGQYEHFRAVAESTDLPIMIYNIPGRTGINMDIETVVRLSDYSNIVAIKEASGDVLNVSALREAVPDDFLIYSGDDALTLPMLSLGAHGIVSVASHIAGRPINEMINAFVQGDSRKALQLHDILMPLFKTLFIDVNPVPAKVLLDELGFMTGGVRLPLVDSDEVTKAEILDVFALFNDNKNLFNKPFGGSDR